MRRLIKDPAERRVGGKVIAGTGIDTFCLADDFFQGASDNSSPDDQITQRLGIKRKLLGAWRQSQRTIVGTTTGGEDIKNRFGSGGVFR